VTIPQPDQNGEFDSPLDGALWMAATHNKRQHPLWAHDKPPLLTEWEKKATTDLAQIRAWAMEYPACNFGSVADNGPIFETDSPEVRKRFGRQFSNTLTIQSSESKGHRYYLPANVEHIAQNATTHGDFSLRLRNAYCVSPGSLHPQTGKQYRVAINAPMTVPASQEIAFWNSERSVKKTVAPAGVDEPIPEGQRNSTITSILGKARQSTGAEYEVLIALARQHNQRCTRPLPDSELETIARSIARYDVKQAGPVIMGGKVMGQPALIAAPANPANWRDSFKSVGELEQGDVRMLIDGVLPEGTIFIGGLPGEGKTFFALSIAKALTTGDPFLGKFFVPEITPVVYLTPEVGGRAFRKRCEKFNIPNDPEMFLCRTVSEGSTLPLDDASLIEAIRRLKPVVILDTIIRFSEAQDENQAMQNKALVDDIVRLRQAGAVAVIGLHHATKAMRDKGMTLENALRGTGDIAASADAVYGLLRDSMLYNNGLGPNEIDVACLKPRDFEPPIPFRIAMTQKSEQGLVKVVSVIDQYRDFLVVTKYASEQASGEALERLVTEDPAISLEELARATGQTTWAIRKALKARHWIKSRGGSKHGSRWVVSPVSGFEPEDVKPQSNVLPVSDVNFDPVAVKQHVN
jgi:hypothetical protein